MGSSSLFSLILKVIGLFFIRDVLESLSHTLSALIYLPQYDSANEGLINVAVTFPSLILYALLAWFFLFRTQTIIRLLRLDKGVADQQLAINADRKTLLTAAVVIAGFWILVNEIPEFIRQALYYYQERKMYARMTRPDISYAGMSAVKIGIGLILIVFNKFIVRLIDWGSGAGKAKVVG